MDKSSEEIIQLYLKQIEEKHKIKIQVLPKSQSKLLKTLRPIIEIFNKNYWDDYVTTLGNTIWVPENWLANNYSTLSMIETIMHECVHIKQANEQSVFVHDVLYLFPQILFIFSLLAFLAIPFGLNWLWALTFLLFLLPIPAPFRYQKELEAYRITILFLKHVYKTETHDSWAEQSIVEQMAGPSYYFAWPFKNLIIKDLENEEALKKELYKEIIDFLKSNNLSS
jgi:hypothetical protein